MNLLGFTVWLICRHSIIWLCFPQKCLWIIFLNPEYWTWSAPSDPPVFCTLVVLYYPIYIGCFFTYPPAFHSSPWAAGVTGAVEPLTHLWVWHHSYFHHVRAWLHTESPEVAPMRDARVTNDVVEAYVTSSLDPISSQQEGHTSHALHRVLPLAQPQTLCTVATFLIEQKGEHWKNRKQFIKKKLIIGLNLQHLRVSDIIIVIEAKKIKHYRRNRIWPILTNKNYTNA